MVRSFGEGEETTFLTLSMYAPDDTPTIRVIRDEHLKDRLSYRVQFAPDTDFTEIYYPVRARFGEKLEGVILTLSLLPYAEIEKRKALAEARNGDYSGITLPVAERDARERAITEFRIKDMFRDDLHLKVGSLYEPMEAMRICADELVGHWGLDAEVQRTLSRRAAPATNPGDWAKPVDYPRGMLRSGFQGFVHFRLTVDANGSPTKCVIQGGSRPVEFADATCEVLMRRATFVPALDAAGNPVTSYWNSSVRWVLP